VLDDTGLDDLLDLVLRSAQCTVVVDAGAIPALGRRSHVDGAVVIAVPNVGEVRHLGDDPAARLGITVSCRDAKTTVTAPDGRTWIEEAGSVGLATSGSGDVAAGIVAGLAARGAAPEAAAVWGARLHGWAGERLPFGFLARDLLDQLPGLLPH
jgi:NAD(P)H-hydrate repair Nnr-like enzyme with NAD(P)H-hydrate dehydratase domain